MEEINATLSFHMDSKHNDKHDLREIDVPYVDTTRSKDNYYPEFNMKRDAAFEYLFSESVRQYNEQQSRSDRRITSYLDKLLEAEERQNQLIREKRAQGASYKELARFKKCVHPSYQFIITIGNMQSNPEFMANGNKADVINQIMKKYIDGFQARNPNAFLYQSARHNDEQGVIHAHLSLIWYADGFTRGMHRQVSQKKALEAMGFYSDTQKGEDGKLHLAIEKWQESEREELKKLCKEFSINIVAGSGSKEHLDREHYIISKQKEENKKKQEEVTEKAEKVVAAQEQIDAQLSNIKNFIETTDNGAVYSIYAENQKNKKKLSEYENQNKYTYMLLAKLWEQYKKENEQYWKQYRSEKDELFSSLKAMRNGVYTNQKRMNDILYHLTDGGQSLLGKLFSLIELLGIFIGNALLKSELDKAEQSYKEFKDKSRMVLEASKETSIALKSKDLEDIQIAFQNWNNAINKIDNNLQAYFEAVTEQYVDR